MAALSMLFTQCRKSEVAMPSAGNPVNITLNVGGNSKADVNPGTGTVTFVNGDKIYVASDGKYVGTLTHNGTVFSGPITGAKNGEPLQFYFLGNKELSEGTPTEGTTTTLTVVISEQPEGLPVISHAPSRENYSPEVTSYSSHLLNKCALVKFSVSGYNGGGKVSVKGMNNKVTVSLTDNAFGYEKDGKGVMTLNKKAQGEYWAILLPQDLVAGGAAYSSDGWIGTYGNVPTITVNGYLTDGVEVSLETPETVNFGTPNLNWSKRNLGATNGATAESWYGDYYAWGATETWYSSLSPLVWKSGYGPGYAWTTCPGNEGGGDSYNESSFNKWKASNLTDNTLNSGVDAATKVWGAGWRMPTLKDWQDLYDNNTFEWLAAGATSQKVTSFKAVASGYLVVKGGKKSISLDPTVYMFLPAAGKFYRVDLSDAGSIGYYWSGSLYSSTLSEAYRMSLASEVVNPQSYYYRCEGYTVRPVR